MDIAHVLLLRDVLQRRRRAQHRRALRRDALLFRNLRDAANPFHMPEKKFTDKYRFTPRMAFALCVELRPYMWAPQRATAVPIHLRVLASLNFFGHGSDQKGVGADHSASMSQPRVSLSIDEVVNALNNPRVLQSNVKFPVTRAERRFIIQRNFQRFQIPGVLGYVDGYHAYIVSPSVHEEQYVNRHGSKSLNVQVVCDSDMVILNINARNPGSSQDTNLHPVYLSHFLYFRQ